MSKSQGRIPEWFPAWSAELSERYPEEGANFFRLDVEEVAPGRGAFFVVRLDGGAIGCGAIRRIDAATAEIKRMYIVPEQRGRGAARELMGALENVAAELRVQRVVLETGERQPEAIALYKRFGFAPIPPFGEYVGSPLSYCMEKILTAR